MKYFLLAILVSGCASINKESNDIVSISNIRLFLVDDFSKLKPEKSLTAEQVSKDLQILDHFLSSAYGARNYIPDNLLEIAKNELHQMSASSTVDLCNKLAETLSQVPDNHLTVAVWGEKCGRRSHGKGSVGKNFVVENKTWEIKSRKENGKYIGLIGITRFALNNDSVWNGFEEAISDLKAKSDVIIIDFRGNSGGDDSKGHKMGAILMGGDAPYPIKRQVKTTTPEARVIWANLFTYYSNNLIDQGKPVPNAVSEMHKQSLKLLEESLGSSKAEEVRKFTGGADWIYPNDDAFSGPMYILMDRKCGSSCESSIDVFEPMPTVKLVGENSFGSLHFGNVGKLVLPNSKVIVQMATHANLFKNNRFTEKVGFEPDIKVPSGEDALKYLLKTLGSD